jgi:hypothetical protein
VVQTIAALPPPSPMRGRGFLKKKIHLYPGWNSIDEDRSIEDTFEALSHLPVQDDHRGPFDWEWSGTNLNLHDGRGRRGIFGPSRIRQRHLDQHVTQHQ